MIYHVAKTGSDQNQGNEQAPFLTISRAASLAMPGDTVIVHEGVYREWVSPKYKGLSDKRRITYQSADQEKVVIKGSERIQDWQLVEGTIWRCELSNTMFGDFNPYAEEIFGEWLLTVDKKKHLGDVYLNGLSFYEVSSYENLKHPEKQTETLDHWTDKMTPVRNPEQMLYVWYAEVDADKTVIFANFQGADPNKENVEINVRRSCFYPVQTGIDYITVRGFEMAQAATPWAPPTADQPGLLGANWSKGWIIENNTIHDAKCSAISIGKEMTTGHNYRSIRKDKPGYQYQLESVFSAERNGWSKEKIGSHIIRNNTLYDCGQNGVVGHLGCVFSEIYNNHIYNIAVKREFYGHEIAGIKLHAAIDTQIHHNRIHDCSLGIWLDWQAQGTRVSKNLLYQNNRDLYVEVSHGPYTVDHNIMASEYVLDNRAQGGAYINNLIAGKMVHQKVLDRSTQYHLPHSTKVAGFAHVYGGDDRYFNNIFISREGLEGVGTNHYEGYTASLEEYIEKVNAKPGDLARFANVEQPVYAKNNAYLCGAKPFSREENPLVDTSFDPAFRVEDKGDEVFIHCQLPDNLDNLPQMLGQIWSTANLPRVRIVDAEFENPDETQLVLDTDLLDSKRDDKSLIGPLAALGKGKQTIKVW